MSLSRGLRSVLSPGILNISLLSTRVIPSQEKRECKEEEVGGYVLKAQCFSWELHNVCWQHPSHCSKMAF